MISPPSWLLLALALFLLLILVVRTVIRGRKDAKQLNDYFVKAAIVHTWLGDEDAKRRLRERNLEYADALDRLDLGLFVERYPQLFDIDTPDEMRDAAEKIAGCNGHEKP